MLHHIPRAAAANECLWHSKCSGPRNNMRSATRAARDDVHRVVTRRSTGPTPRTVVSANTRLQRDSPAGTVSSPFPGAGFSANRDCASTPIACSLPRLDRRTAVRSALHRLPPSTRDLRSSVGSNGDPGTACRLTQYHDEYLNHRHATGCAQYLARGQSPHCCRSRAATTAVATTHSTASYGGRRCEIRISHRECSTWPHVAQHARIATSARICERIDGSDVCMAYARALRSAVTGTRVVTACIVRAPTRMRTPGHTGCTVDGGAECAASARRRNRVRRNAGGRVLQAAAARMLAYMAVVVAARTCVVTAHVMRAATRMRTPGHTGCTVDGGAECAASARRWNRVRRNAGGRVLQAAAAQMLAYAPGAP